MNLRELIVPFVLSAVLTVVSVQVVTNGATRTMVEVIFVPTGALAIPLIVR